MIGRLLFGLLLGIASGAAVAFGLLRGLDMATFDGVVFPYLAAAVTGVLTGFVAGRPIWAKGALIESILKAVAGAAIASFGMFALRTWGTSIVLPLQLLDPRLTGAAANLPAASLPMIGAVLGGFYGIDNTPSDDEKRGPRVAAPKGVRVADAGASLDEDEAEGDVKAKGRGRK